MSDATDYRLMESQLAALLQDETDILAASANFVALLNAGIPDINWLGIYVLRGDELVLGPFQGLPACVHIPLGQGVCGTAAAERKTLRVADVHGFAGHIACDPASASELVVPLIAGDSLLGVLDIDSPVRDRFTEADETGVRRLAQRFVELLPKQNDRANKFI